MNGPERLDHPARRVALRRCGGLVLLAAAGIGTGRLAAQEGDGRVVEIEARRFEFRPNEIRARPGEVLTLALRSVDVMHGFSLPDLGVRTDVMPGRVTRIRLPALPAGRVVFLCDVACGHGHGEMEGVLIVEA